ncbi:hypothetical protein EDD65_104162 [Keratinibaculum paraultunense]|uniref:Cof subfamily protein (Haloacid dehalogenase superfamily)/HAD superfamily hydrolase (TIGR01484 family) n=1 Tax=Keratinibaculum paraultunense TaxID=1278232 RepID=A0A4R3KXP4_9FIRM|nr:Cof-type HAD-IIB family hydrolase [Keratinibaculum paraultunense]QQY78997.1 Cof-type HAD-IIB family hydrolase [Keratinibaculum paraultunense]TCS90619.1 hypothetical protein EDD65_104162 [Keratinibaculum paraultunense]
MYKLVAIDLDGTLLDDDKNIPKENIDLINKLIDRGYEVVIATGRRYWSAKQFLKDIDRSLVVLANNGNIVRYISNDEILIKKCLNLDDFKILIEESKKRGLNPILHVDRYEDGYDMVIEMKENNSVYSNYISPHEKRYKIVENYLELDDDILAVIFVGDKDILEDFYLDINKKYPNRYSSHIMENIQNAEALLEIMNPLGNKWLSLKEYAQKKGISPEEIIAIGDDNNDAQMIKNAGCGIAMKNASQQVKEVADIITKKDNNQAGVAFELRRILKL